MSINAIKTTFQTAAKDPVRCIAARMRLTEDRKHQILEFDIAQDGKQRTVVSDPIPMMGDLHAAASVLAAAVVAGHK